MEVTIYRHILIPTDGSALSAKAVAEGVKLASQLGAHVTFLFVVTPFASLGDLDHAFAGLPESFHRQARAYLEEEARTALAGALSVANSGGVAADTLQVESKYKHEAIISAAKSKGADLIMMASHGRSGVKGILLGSVTQKVLTHTDVPVLVCR